jgi:hypothetical protein
MANPVLTPTTNKTTYAPGESITGTWTVVDADNATMTLRLQGADLSGLPIEVDVTINRSDPFTMERIFFVEENVDLTFNNTNRTFSGTVPSA